MVKRLSLTNSNDIVCNSVRIINGDLLQDIFDIFLTKVEVVDLVSIAPEVPNTLGEIAESIGNDPRFFTTIDNEINLKSNIADSYDKQYINNKLKNKC